MKKCVVTFTLLFVSFVLASAQDSIQYLNLKRGIYYSIEEVRNNSPKYDSAFYLFKRSKSDIKFLGGGQYSFDIVGDENSKKLQKEIFGISDNGVFYISAREVGKGRQGFYVCYLSGPYIVVNYTPSLASYTEFDIIQLLASFKSGAIYNLDDENLYPLNNHALNVILSDYPDIAKQYPTKRNRIRFAAEILEKINAEIKSRKK